MLHGSILRIQAELKVPKNQLNKFGGYKYRSCEDIVEAAKPLCIREGLILQLSDEVVAVGGRNYVKATACLVGEKGVFQSYGWAREEETKKGMDGAQITGAASSYARKYALNGLFAIDDTADPDATNKHGKEAPVISPAKEAAAELNELQIDKVTETADLIVQLMAHHPGDEKAVYQAFKKLDSDERVALWNLWSSDSRLRSRVKAICDSQRQIEAQASPEKL